MCFRGLLLLGSTRLSFGVVRTNDLLAGSRVVSLKLSDSRSPWYHDPLPQPSVALSLVSVNFDLTGYMAFEWSLRVKKEFGKWRMRGRIF